MAKYGERTKESVRNAIRKYMEGELMSGRTGQPVTSLRQAIAIGLSEARKKGYKLPPRKSKKYW